ncbi:MAG: preprotein translocase subunit SecY [Chloroflexota bacterium]
MLQAVINAFKLRDLRNRILFTLGVLVIFRLAAHIPLPGVDPEGLKRVFEANQLLGLLNMFSGGAMMTFSIVAMGVYPYITAQIIVQLLTPIIPQLEELAQEGEAGRQKMALYTRLVTVPLAALQGYAQASLLARPAAGGVPVIANWGFSSGTWLSTLSVILTLTAGTLFAVWLGELIDEQGIGNGLSILIFGGIVAQMPQNIASLWVSNPWSLLLFGAITIVTVVGIVFVQEGQRRIPVQYAKRVRGTKMYGGQRVEIPLPVNSAGMIPLIFAVSILLFPGMVASYFVYAETQWIANIANIIVRVFDSNGIFYWVMYFLMVVGFTYFYTDVIFAQQDLAGNLRKQGGAIVGYRPGKPTSDYLNGVLRRITLVGALFLGIVAILPFLMRLVSETGTMLINSTGLLIVVGVVLDTMKQLEAQLRMRHYEGFLKK